MYNRHIEPKVGVGIDLGTSNILIYVENLGVIYNEPSVIALEVASDKVVAVGKEAAKMLGRSHNKIRVVKPLNQGEVVDLDAAKKLIENAFERLDEYSVDLKKSTVLLTCASEMSNSERESLIDLAKRIGVGEVIMEDEVKAGAIGAGLDVFSSNGVMTIDIGGGSTDVGVLCLGQIIVNDSTRLAGNYIDNVIVKYCHAKHGLLIGEKTAEQIKKEVGSVAEKKEYAECEQITTIISGRDMHTGLPRKQEINQAEIRELMLPIFEEISKTVLSVLKKTSPELCADIILSGIVLTGGSSLIEGVADFFAERVEMDVKVATNPLTANVEGSRTLLQNRELYLGSARN